MNTDKKKRMSPVASLLIILNLMVVTDAVKASALGTADAASWTLWAGWLVGLNLVVWVIKSDGEMGYREVHQNKQR